MQLLQTWIISIRINKEQTTMNRMRRNENILQELYSAHSLNNTADRPKAKIRFHLFVLAFYTKKNSHKHQRTSTSNVLYLKWVLLLFYIFCAFSNEFQSQNWLAVLCAVYVCVCEWVWCTYLFIYVTFNAMQCIVCQCGWINERIGIKKRKQSMGCWREWKETKNYVMQCKKKSEGIWLVGHFVGDFLCRSISSLSSVSLLVAIVVVSILLLW